MFIGIILVIVGICYIIFRKKITLLFSKYNKYQETQEDTFYMLFGSLFIISGLAVIAGIKGEFILSFYVICFLVFMLFNSKDIAKQGKVFWEYNILFKRVPLFAIRVMVIIIALLGLIIVVFFLLSYIMEHGVSLVSVIR